MARLAGTKHAKIAMTQVDPGFQPDSVLAFRVALPNASYREDHNRIASFDTLLARLDGLPQVVAAGLTTTNF